MFQNLHNNQIYMENPFTDTEQIENNNLKSYSVIKKNFLTFFSHLI